MRTNIDWRYTRAILTCLSMSAGIATSAGAQEYCVACTGPDAVYRCVVDVGKPQQMPLKLLCVSTLARTGGHATCAVRGGTVFDCNGPIRRIGAATPSVGSPSAAGSAVTTAAGAAAIATQGGAAPQRSDTAAPKPSPVSAVPTQGPASAARASPQPSGQRPHKQSQQTVEQLAKQAAKSTSNTLKKAGKSIKRSTSKAWNCIASLFNSC